MAESQNGAGGSGAGTIFAFLAGAAVGAGLALLLAPRAGAETRRALRRSLGDAETSFRASLDHGLSMLEEARARITEAVEAGREAARREAARVSREWAAPRATAVDGESEPSGATTARPGDPAATGPVVR